MVRELAKRQPSRQVVNYPLVHGPLVLTKLDRPVAATLELPKEQMHLKPHFHSNIATISKGWTIARTLTTRPHKAHKTSCKDGAFHRQGNENTPSRIFIPTFQPAGKQEAAAWSSLSDVNYATIHIARMVRYLVKETYKSFSSEFTEIKLMFQLRNSYST